MKGINGKEVTKDKTEARLDVGKFILEVMKLKVKEQEVDSSENDEIENRRCTELT